MSEQTSDHPATRRETKQARLDNPTGFLYLTRHESVPLLIDALLDLPPGREWNKTELAEHAGITRQTVGAHIDVLVETAVVEPVSDTAPRRYRLADSEVVERLFELNGALNATKEP